jgi:hypothetical protein
MIAILILLRSLLGSLFKSRARITAENLLLRHQLNIARRHGPKRAHLSNWDRWGLVWVYRIVPDALNAVSLVCACHGHSRPADCCSITLAERLCRTGDRFDPERMSRPHHRHWRTATSPDHAKLYRLLQPSPDSSRAEQGCPLDQTDRAPRGHPSSPRSGWSAPPIWSNLVFGRDRETYHAHAVLVETMRHAVLLINC